MKEINSGSADKRIEIILSAWVVIKRKDQFSDCFKITISLLCLCLFAWCLDDADANDSIVSVSCHYGTSSTLSLWRSHGIIALNSILKHTLNTLIQCLHWIIVIAEWSVTFFRALTHCCQHWTVVSWCLQSKDVMSALRSPHPVCTCLLVEHSAECGPEYQG